ncbi:hypothetical protein YC2023_082318 [Brassica napus]
MVEWMSGFFGHSWKRWSRSGGRFRVGVGFSRVDVSPGWWSYGVYLASSVVSVGELVKSISRSLMSFSVLAIDSTRD